MSNSNLISSIELTRKNLRAQIEGLRVEAEDPHYKILDQVEGTKPPRD